MNDPYTYPVVGLRGKMVPIVYRGERCNLESFNREHPWVVQERADQIAINHETGKPKYLPRRFGSEYAAKIGLPLGCTVREERTLERMNMESMAFLNPIGAE
jgi:hypothetical protein